MKRVPQTKKRRVLVSGVGGTSAFIYPVDDLPQYRRGGVFKTIGEGVTNVGATMVNNLSALAGGAIGNDELIPEIGMVGDRKMQDIFGKINDVTGEIYGAAGKIGAQAALMSVGVPPAVTGAIQQGVGAATAGIDNRPNDDNNMLAQGIGQSANQLAMLSSQYLTPEPKMELGGNVRPEYEAEGREVVEHAPMEQPAVFGQGNVEQLSSTASKVVGPQHEQGGVKMAGGERMYSDKMKVSADMTFAKAAENLHNKKGKFEKKLAEPDAQPESKKTAELMLIRIDKELDALFETQELQKKMDHQFFQRYGGHLKYGNGGEILGVSDDPVLAGELEQAIALEQMSPKAFMKRMGGILGTHSIDPLTHLRFGGPTNPPDKTKLTQDAPLGWDLSNDPLSGAGYLVSTQLDNIAPRYFPMESFQGSHVLDNGQRVSTPGLEPEFQGVTSMQGRTPNIPYPLDIQNQYAGATVPQTPDNERTTEVNAFGEAQPYLEGMAEYAPTIYNVGQGLFGKKDYYENEANGQLPQAYRELELSKQYDISENLAGNLRGAEGVRTQAEQTTNHAGQYLQVVMAANRAKQQADAQAYDTKQRYESEANARAAQMRAAFGEADRAEAAKTQIMAMQTDAKKRDFLVAGLEGMSGITQRNQVERSQREMDEEQMATLKAFAPNYWEYYLQKTQG
jgi:hypothetical protein